MGISGLLQALKSIQVTRHLEEYSGKTIAVDAYVWLHRGLYSCATDLATGKKTHKYVEYAMHRVRLLRHYKINPYIVFDGGPLPAKKGTEQERKQKREEYLSRGNALAAQGKHTQARECYVKCVDVTPQMAFQFIKALRAEGIPYVVAPYEADAQLAYLEKIGLVDAILTEDSDLLVFGCKTVLYKLDDVGNTVVSISRDHFGSVVATASDPNSISLFGWSDAQFRAMAILSGCDYLPSIPGIGLKTANTLLRKWKTAEQVVKLIAREGKKSVPVGYWKEFQLAEMCFLHQRVYCPLTEKLVHLTGVGPNWNQEFDHYVGSAIDPASAKGIATGDVCPISRLPMVDINPGFIHRATRKALPRVSISPSKSTATKGRGRETLPNGGILSFFGPSPIIPPRVKASAPILPVKTNFTGKASGKRTLADVMDNDMEMKKKRLKSPPAKNQTRHSKFFLSSRSKSVQRRHSDGDLGMAGPSCIRTGDNKENECIVNDDGDGELVMSEPELDGSDLSLKAQVDRSDMVTSMALDEVDFPDAVEQEDGYISPSPSCSKDAQDLSSPVRPDGGTKTKHSPGSVEMTPGTYISEDEERDFGTDILSSPASAKRPQGYLQDPEDYETPIKWVQNGFRGATKSSETILVGPSPTPTKRAYHDMDDVPSPTLYRGPDLRDMLWADCVTELEVSPDVSVSTVSPSLSPDTPKDDSTSILVSAAGVAKEAIDVDAFDLDVEEDEERTKSAGCRTNAVMAGWRQKWALQPVQGKQTPKNSNVMFASGSGAQRTANLRRSETTVTAAGRHLTRGSSCKTPKLTQTKASLGQLVFVETFRATAKATTTKALRPKAMGDST